jgi:hypothetical protein
MKRKGRLAAGSKENNTVNSSIMVDWIDSWLTPVSGRVNNSVAFFGHGLCSRAQELAVKEACMRNSIDICMIPTDALNTATIRPLSIEATNVGSRTAMRE